MFFRANDHIQLTKLKVKVWRTVLLIGPAVCCYVRCDDFDLELVGHCYHHYSPVLHCVSKNGPPGYI